MRVSVKKGSASTLMLGIVIGRAAIESFDMHVLCVARCAENELRKRGLRRYRIQDTGNNHNRPAKYVL